MSASTSLLIKPNKLSLSILFPHSESSFSFLLIKNPKSLITPNNVFINISGEKDFQEEEQEYRNNLRKQGWYSPRPIRAHTSRHLQRTRTLVLFSGINPNQCLWKEICPNGPSHS